MDAERWELIQSVFHDVADHPSGEQAVMLEAACGEDRDLLLAVRQLLDADANGDSLLDGGAAPLAHALFDERREPAPGVSIGPYRVLGPLGEGGMGVVYLAERDDIGQRAAIKVLRDAWVSPAGHERFVREQQTLAQLAHPSIARVLDADTLDDGTPWFAMEYVEGTSLTAHCEAHGCSLRERLRLFGDVCEAVQHAHRKLIVHLDLKPSNVLVTGEGEVKLLDFGIARHLNGEGGTADATVTAHRLLSLNYASPEQIVGEPLDVQADVYALGVLLYELITGAVPLDLSNVTAATLAQALQEEPRRPSSHARSSTAAVQASRVEWRELDALCATALSRDRSLRYQSVDSLTADVARFLKEEPLEASAGRFRYYRLRKFLRRNRRPVAAAATVAVTVAALVAFFNVRLLAVRDEAMASEARTRRIFELMLNLFEGDDSAAGPAEGLRVVTLLERGVRDAANLRNEPALQAELNFTLGGLFHKLGHLDRADALLQSALAAQQRLLPGDDPPANRTRLALAALRVDQSETDAAKQLAAQALDAARRRYAADSQQVAIASALMGKVLVTEGRYDEGIPLLERSVEVLSAGPNKVELSEALGDLANGLYYEGRIAESEAVNRRGIIHDRAAFGDHHPNVAVGLFNLGSIALDHADYAEGERLFRSALTVTEEWYGATHPKTANNVLMLGRALVYQGRLAEAAPLYERALATTAAAYGEDSIRYAGVLSLSGDLARARDRLDDAERLFTRAAAIFDDRVGANHEFYLHQLSNLASVDLARGRHAAAEAMLRDAVERLAAVVPQQRYTGIAQIRLGAALAGRRQFTAAERHALAGMRILEAAMKPAAVEIQEGRALLIDVYTGLGLLDKAREIEAAYRRYGARPETVAHVTTTSAPAKPPDRP